MKQRRVINSLICRASNLWLIWDYAVFISGLVTFSGVKPDVKLENSYFPWLEGRKCPSSHGHLWWSSVGTHGSMGACLCGCVISAGAWSVHLAVVQWAAHGIMMTAAAASVVWREWKKSKNSWEENNHKKRKEERSTESQNDAGLKSPILKKGDAGRKKGGKRPDELCLRWIIFVGWCLCVPAVDGGLSERAWACLRRPFLFFTRGAVKTFKSWRKNCPWRVSPPPRWGRRSATRIEDAKWPHGSVGLTWQQSTALWLPVQL